MKSCLWLIPFVVSTAIHSEENSEKPKPQRVETLTPTPSDKYGRKTVDIQETTRPLNQFLDYLSTVSGVNIKAENEKLEKEFKKLDVKVPAMSKVSWHKLLQIACEQHELRIDEQLLSGNVLVIWRPERVTINVKDGDLLEVIWSIANQAKLNVIVDPDVKGSISATLTNVPWDSALHAVLKSTEFVISREGGGAWRVTR